MKQRSSQAAAAWKADVYRRTGASLFIESDVRQAVEIATLARKDVLCIDTMQMIRPGTVPTPRPAEPARAQIAFEKFAGCGAYV